MSEDGSKATRRTCLRVNCLFQLPGCLDITEWWKGTKQPDSHIPVMKWRVAFSPPVNHRWSSVLFQSTSPVFRCMRFFTLSQRDVHAAVFAFVAVTCIPELFLSHQQKETQEALVSKPDCLLHSVLLSKSLSHTVEACVVVQACQPLPFNGEGSSPQNLSCYHLAKLSISLQVTFLPNMLPLWSFVLRL